MGDGAGRTIDSPARISKAAASQMRNQGYQDGRAARDPRSLDPIYRQGYRRGAEARVEATEEALRGKHR